VAKNNESIDRFVKRLNSTIEKVNGPAEMRAIGEFMIEKIRVRTQLGYGVEKNLSEKYPLNNIKRTQKYEDFRKKFKGLSSFTSPKKHNLTLTGSMLDSLKIKSMSKTAIRIGPTGSDMFGVSNSSKAFWQEKMGRIFLRLSFQEVKQIRIFWLRTFKLLLK
jgi:hypothetical protein